MSVSIPRRTASGRNLSRSWAIPEWANDPMFKDRIKVVDECPEKADAFLEPWLMSHGKEEIYHLCQDNGVPAAPVRNVQDAAKTSTLKSATISSKSTIRLPAN